MRESFLFAYSLLGFALLVASPESVAFSTQGRGLLYTIESLDMLTDAVTQQSDGNYQITSSITIANQTHADILKLSLGVALRFAKGITLRIEGTHNR